MTLLRSAVLVLAVVGAFASVAAAPVCEERLAPLLLEHLGGPDYLRTRDVAWVDDSRVAIAASRGIRIRSIPDRTSRLLPANIPEVLRVASDGRTIVAANSQFVDVAVDVASGKTIHEREKYGMRIGDVGVAGKRFAVLGFPVKVDGVDFGNLWTGTVGAQWEAFHLLRPTPDSMWSSVRERSALFSGSVAMGPDGSVWSITPEEPGVVRYNAEGRALPPLGKALRELVVPSLAKYSLDPLARYTEVLNLQPMADDLVLLPEGPAIVVRKFSSGTISWALWFPGDEKTRRRIALAIDQKQIVGGHLRCDAKGTRLACVFGKLPKIGQPEEPYLAIFDLAAVDRAENCK
jgi:hypothetical protein